MGGNGGRASYLLDGRRVTVRDLLEAGLLRMDEQLTFARPRRRETHVARVAENGWLVVDGRPYETPSRAARVAADTGQVDGWTAWVTSEGTTLHALRAQLLDQVADEASAAGPIEDADEVGGLDSPLPRHEFLKQVRQAAEQGDPQKVTVRDLLRHWGGRARGHRLSRRIEADLDNYGLTTSPNFLRVTLADEVALVAVQPASVPEPQPAVVRDGGVGVDSVAVTVIPDESAERREIGLTLGNLPSASSGLVSVKPTATFEEAMTKMLLNDFSQLPVLKTKHRCEGAVTWRSIARARFKDSDAPFTAAIVHATTLAYDTELNRVLGALQAEDFVFVRNDHNEISGIVTAADVVQLYGELATPFLLIGELDQELRRIVTAIDLDTVCTLCDSSGTRKISSHDDLTMGDYQRVLDDPACWAKLGWPLDRAAFVARLDELRQLRNDIVHFNPDPVPDGTVNMLRHMLAAIRTFAADGEGS